jgi:hypothetical protein
MKAQNSFHLQEEQILKAVVDENELAAEEQQHLLECATCKKKVVQFNDELQKFGQKAIQAVPPFSQAVKLPSVKPASISRNNGWLPFFGAAAMAGLVMFFYFMGLETMPPSQLTIIESQEYLLEDESLMREISEMVEYPLSEDMYEITGENGIDFDDDFLQFVVPDIQDDFQSEFNIHGGIKLC